MLVHHLTGGRVESLAFGPDGRTLAVPHRLDGLLVWDDVTAGGPPRALPRGFDNPHGRVRFSADGRRVGCRGWFRAVAIDPAGGDVVAFETEVMDCEYYGALTPDGTAVVLAQRKPRVDPAPDAHTRLSLRPLSDPQFAGDRWTLELPCWVWDEAAFFPGAAAFVNPELVPLPGTAKYEAHWVVRDTATGTATRSTPPLGRRPVQAAVSSDGRWVAGVHTKHLVAWRADDPGAPPVERKNDGRLHFTGLAFHPSGAYLATTSTDTTVRVYDTATWEVVRTYAWDVGRLRCVAFSPDGLLAAAGGEKGQIVVWDVDL